MIHLYLSNSPEHYLQEIGRAGRDGRKALAIALPLLEEVPVRHSLSHSNIVSRLQIQNLLRTLKKLFEAATNSSSESPEDTNRFLHIALPVKATSLECDCKQETLETFLSLLETIGGDNPLIHVEGLNYDKAAIAMKKRSLKKLAEKEHVAHSILEVAQCIDPPLLDNHDSVTTKNPSSFQRQFLAYSMGSYSFSIVAAANHLGASAEPRHIFAALRRLQSSNELELSLDTSDMGRIFHLKFTEAGSRVFGTENDYKSTEEILTSELYDSFSKSSSSSAEKVLDMHYILDQVASVSSPASAERKEDGGKSASLMRFQHLVNRYFEAGLESSLHGKSSEILPPAFYEIRKNELQSDTFVLLQDIPQMVAAHIQDDPLGFGRSVEYSCLSIAKFLHGIESPRTPYLQCRNHPVFGKWRHVDFSIVHEAIRNDLKPLLENPLLINKII